MTKISKIIFLFSFILFLGCQLQENKSIKTSGYAPLKQIPEYLWSHFPEYLTKGFTLTYAINAKDDNIVLYNLYIPLSDSINNTIGNLQYIVEYLSNDKYLIAINSWEARIRDKHYKEIQIENKIYYPVPYFWGSPNKQYLNLFNPNTKSGLSSDFVIYVIDSKSGVYWDGLKPKDYMPDGWENGYSKGVCINEKEKVIIYWFVVW